MPKDELPDLNGHLKFEDDKGAGRSKWLAALFAIVLVGWMGSGYILPSQPDVEPTDEPVARAVAVAVMTSSAQDIDLVLISEGQSIPDRATNVTAKVGGEVLSVSADRGDLVAAGQEIGRLDAATIEAQLVQAQTQLDQATSDLEKSTSLQKSGITTEDRVLQARAAKASAEAAVAAAQEQLENTVIRAPFAGRLNDMTLDEGEFVNSGDVVAEVLDNNPLSIVVQVPQQALSRLKKGQTAKVSFITGEVRDGTVAFIGANADSQTRTFRVEVTVDNPDSEMPAGLSARIAIPTGKARGHFISPAILSLGTDGELGIKTVTDDNIVEFAPVSIVRAQTDGIWVTGLPESADIITVGQGFVNAGDTVDPRPSDAPAATEVAQ
ncbi:membrane fusion protein, multidrug efflux system [Aliiroseovarius sediminilitoris]|uniref:Membrane fusion protein, multidrug efflux system n=1 Tax=Aliiroseovarius sediminilitoris TaxID=1173584 RepID=A0A1I0NMC8_9RHOB|nr:efflux RND transporter periplasmic adaptor subunit [Aliiroseovarius sediminilitoris]SEW02460.1 membrane fusion protein, multidrug efflux system [Aliiroseovarius sediminilitoris]